MPAKRTQIWERHWYQEIEDCDHILKNVHLKHNCNKEDWGLPTHFQESLPKRQTVLATTYSRICYPNSQQRKDWELLKTHIFQEPGNRLVPRGWELQYILKNVIPKFATKRDWELHAQIFKNPGERLLPRDWRGCKHLLKNVNNEVATKRTENCIPAFSRTWQQDCHRRGWGLQTHPKFQQKRGLRIAYPHFK